MLLEWVEALWVRKFTIVILIVEEVLDVLGALDESLNMERVIKVKIEVILKSLQRVHVVGNICVSSDSWEGKGGVVELPGVHLHFMSNINILLVKAGLNLHGSLIMVDVKGAGEVV